MRKFAEGTLLLALLASLASVATSTDAEGAAKGKADPKRRSNPAVPSVTISRETTYLVSPLRADGYVDYVEALNRQCSQGVTPQNNAAVSFWRAIGPKPLPEEVRKPFFQRLRIAPLPDEGPYLVWLWEYLQHLEDAGTPEKEGLDEQGWLDRHLDQYDRAQEVPWSANEYPLLAKRLEANRQPLAMLIAAARRPRFFSPLVAKRGGSLVSCQWAPGYRESRDAAQMLTARAMLRLNEGKIDAAWQDLLASHRLARLLAQGPFLINQLYAVGLEYTALRGDVSLAHHGRLTAKQAERFQADLQKLPAVPNSAAIWDIGERYFGLASVCALARREAGALELWKFACDDSWHGVLETLATDPRMDWNQLLRIGNANYDRMVEAFRKPTSAQRRAALDRLQRELEKNRNKQPDPKTLAKRLTKRLPPKTLARHLAFLLWEQKSLVLSMGLALDDRMEMISSLGQLAFALAAYRSDHGRYPVNLNELSPKYIAKIPSDGFADGELHYERRGDGFLLYSVGPNGRDDGGRSPLDILGEDTDDDGGHPDGVRDDIVLRTRTPAR